MTNVDQDANIALKQNRRWLWPVAAAVVLAGLWWFVTSLNQTLLHIWPGGGVSYSTDMTPYEIRLRTKVNPAGPGNLDEPREWILNPPRAFFVDETGSNGDVRQRDGNTTSGSYFVYFESIVAADGKSLVPMTLVPKQERQKNNLTFHLSNEEAPPQFAKAGSCVPQHLFNKVLGQGTASGRDGTPCKEVDFRCTVWSEFDGWAYQIAVTHDLYAEPERACALARAFLQKITIKRDALN